MPTYTIRSLFFGLFLIMGVCATSMLVVTQRLSELRQEVEQYQTDLYAFYRLSQELKQSSDHLSKFARAYAVTGNEYWKRLFDHVLDVREGRVETPQHSDYEYWDLISTQSHFDREVSESISLLDKIRESGISSTEYLDLKNALMLSNELVKLERAAFEAIKRDKPRHLGSDKNALKTEMTLAQSLLYGEEYFSEKSKIMKAIGSAHQSILTRILSNIERAKEKSRQQTNIYSGLGAVLIFSIILSFVLLWRLYIKPLTLLQNTVVEQVKNKDFDFTIKHKAYAELQQFIQSLNTVFHHISLQLNQNTLVKDFNIILRTSQSITELGHEVGQFLLRRFPIHQVSLYLYQDNKLVRVGGSGNDAENPTNITDTTTTQMSVLLSGKPYSMKSLGDKYTAKVGHGLLKLNEIYFFPLCVNDKPIGLLELATSKNLSETQYQWLVQILDDLAVSVQLTQNIEFQRQAEQKVLEQSQLNQEILNATPNPMYCLSPKDQFLTINAKFIELVGLPEEQIIGKSPKELFHSKDVIKLISETHKALIKERTSKTYELTLEDAQKQPREILVFEASFNNVQGEFGGIVGILLDMTERKQMESELRQAKETADA